VLADATRQPVHELYPLLQSFPLRECDGEVLPLLEDTSDHAHGKPGSRCIRVCYLVLILVLVFIVTGTGIVFHRCCS